MIRYLFIVIGFSLLIGGVPANSDAQHITVPIHYSKWIPNYVSPDSLRGIASYSNIPIAFFMKDTGKVEQYEKLEIGISLPEEAKIQIANFIRSGKGINPFDPDQISIKAVFSYIDRYKHEEFYLGNVNYDFQEAFAFYYEEFHHEMNDERFGHGYWKKDTTSFNFRIRFAPDKKGWWGCTINIFIENKLKFTLPTFDFLCTPGNSNGFITGVSENKRQLQFENGINFFGVGQNIPIADLPNPVKPAALSQFREQPPQGFTLQRKYIEDLAENGGNLVRIMHGEWADALEWEKLNDYSMNMNFAWEFDQTVNLCRDKNIYILWLQQVHTAFMARNPYNNDALAWPANPYHVYLKLEKPEDFFTSKEALKIYKNKVRYMLSRWGYSRMIAAIQPMSEINEMAANITDSPAHHPYFTDTSFRNDVAHWFTEIKNFIQKDLNYPFLVGSSFTGDVGAHVSDDPVMKIADFNDYHPYGQNRNRNVGARFGGINVTPGYGIFKRYEKPVIIGEMGVWDTEHLQPCHENEFHNDIWGTAFIGGWSTGLHWHDWEDNYKMNLRESFIGISRFLKEIRFTGEIKNNLYTDWQPHRWPEQNINDTLYSDKKDNYFESLYMTGNKCLFNNNRAFGWVHNRSAYWYNYPETECEKNASNKKSKLLKGKKQYRPYDDDAINFEKCEGDENKGKRVIRISNIQNLKKYRITWYDTETGEAKTYTTQFHWFGKFKISIPDSINETKFQDLAYIIRPEKRAFDGQKIHHSKF